LEGSVRKAGNKLRITVQLIDARTEEHLWSEEYDRELKDVFTIQSDIAHRVARALRVQLMAGEKRQIEKKTTENLEAYDFYLKGRASLDKRTEERFNRGIKYFELAIEKDPACAPAYAGLADAYGLLGLFGALPPREVMPKAKRAAVKALEIDDALAEAHTSLGFVRSVYDWAWLDAEREFRRSIELKPSYATGHHWYAVTYLTPMRRLDEAIAEMKRAQELNPLCLTTNEWLGTELLFARQYDKAIDQFQKTLEVDPNFPPAHFYLAQTYVQKAMHKEAITEVQNAITLSGRLPRTVATLGRIYAVAGEVEKAQKVLDELKELSKRRYVPSYYVALIYVDLGQMDQAFQWLEKAYEERESELVFLKVDPSLDSLRSDSRFIALLKKTNLEIIEKDIT
ncbi:MAG: tetratricopeptide repeat protein, partial [Bacteroidota bacterium]